MAKAKIQCVGALPRIVTLETDATIGAAIGVNLTYQGQVQTLAQLQALFGGSSTAAASSGSSGPSLSSILTTKGDLVTRDSNVQRLGIGTTGQLLRVSASGMPEWATINFPVGANPTATIGLSAVNGVATTFMRSDAAPALNQGIAPTWTALHTFTSGLTLTAGALTLPAASVADAALSSNVPLKNAANTFAATQTINPGNLVLSDGTSTMFIVNNGGAGYFGTSSNHAVNFRTNNTDRGAIAAAGGWVINEPSSGALLTLDAASGTIALKIGAYNLLNYTSSAVNFGGITAAQWDTLNFYTSGAARVKVITGVQVGAPTGGDQGAGTLNATGLFINGVAVLTSVGGTGLFADGSNTNPSVSFASDPDTGMYRSAANTLNFATNGVSRFQIGSGGAAQFTSSVQANAFDLISGGTLSNGMILQSSGDVRLISAGALTLRLEYNGSDHTGTFSGIVVTAASVNARASLRLPHGSVPSAPVNGDMWTTTAGLYVQINGSTVGPLS